MSARAAWWPIRMILNGYRQQPQPNQLFRRNWNRNLRFLTQGSRCLTLLWRNYNRPATASLVSRGLTAQERSWTDCRRLAIAIHLFPATPLWWRSHQMMRVRANATFVFTILP